MTQALNPSDAPSWYQFVTDFDTAYGQFYDNYNGLMATGPYLQQNHPEMMADYNQLLQDGSTIAYKLEQLKAQRDYIYSWLQWLQTGASNIGSFIGSAAQSTYNAAVAALGLSGLGQILQVAEVAVTLVAAYAILSQVGAWIAKVYDMAQRTNALQNFEAQGMSPAQAASAVNNLYGAPADASTNILGIPWTLIIFSAIAIFLGPPLLKMIGERK